MATQNTIQFVHANAYAPGCYQKFLSLLGKEEISTPYLRPLWSDSDPRTFRTWHQFAEDLILYMDMRGLKNVIGIGHSLGGVTSWLAALKRPDLFSKLILIDPVILRQTRSRGVSWFPYELKKKWIPIVKVAANRRDEWADRQAIIDHLGAKKIFKRFEPEVFEDFLTFGFKPKKGQLTLSYPRTWEARVYASPPNLWPLLPKNNVPVTIIRAQYSDVIDDLGWSEIQQIMPNATFIQMDDVGHLIPFEQPGLLSDLILDII